MKILTMGCGYIGSVLAADLAEEMPSAEIVISDVDRKKAEEVVARAPVEGSRLLR